MIADAHRVPIVLEGGPRDGEVTRTFDYVRRLEVAYVPEPGECPVADEARDPDAFSVGWLTFSCTGCYVPDPDRPGIWTWSGHLPHRAPPPWPTRVYRRRRLRDRLADAWRAAREAWGM